MITARGKSAVSVLDLRLQGGDHNRSMGLIIVRGWGCSSGLHPSQASRFIVDGALGFDQAYLHPRPAALLHPSLHARGGCGVGLAGFLSLCVWCFLPPFCCAAPLGLLVFGWYWFVVLCIMGNRCAVFCLVACHPPPRTTPPVFLVLAARSSLVTSVF